jgi:hypothetical protein
MGTGAASRGVHIVENTFMNTHTARLSALMVSALLCTGSVWAQSATTPSERMEHRIDARQARQEQRIDRGVQSGQLTRHETARLEHQQAHIDRVEDRALSDGSLKPPRGAPYGKDAGPGEARHPSPEARPPARAVRAAGASR